MQLLLLLLCPFPSSKTKLSKKKKIVINLNLFPLFSLKRSFFSLLLFFSKQQYINMRFLKKTNILPLHPQQEYYQEGIMCTEKMYNLTADLNFEKLQQQKSNARANTLTHVMHLFEEKNKYPPTPVTGPLPIKANGAIVVNRPSNHPQTAGTISSLPLYLQDELSDDEIEQVETDMGEMKTMLVEDEGSSCNNSSSPEENSSIIEEEEEEGIDMTDLVHEENKRLRQQILIEREQHEKWRIGQEKLKQELTFAHQTIKNLQRMTDRFQNLFLPHHATISSSSNKRARRQSTGVTFDYNSNRQHQQIIESYERKLQILLNEINAMESQEKDFLKRSTSLKSEKDKLLRKLKYKDDIIRQLAYDLQYERSCHQQQHQ